MTDDEAQLRAALAQELGFWPARVDPESVERYRREAAADVESVKRFADKSRRNQYRHVAELKRQEAVEAAGRAAVADLYE
jgi:hypothetical protein